MLLMTLSAFHLNSRRRLFVWHALLPVMRRLFERIRKGEELRLRVSRARESKPERPASE